jgi:hypothetical protein
MLFRKGSSLLAATAAAALLVASACSDDPTTPPTQDADPGIDVAVNDAAGDFVAADGPGQDVGPGQDSVPAQDSAPVMDANTGKCGPWLGGQCKTGLVCDIKSCLTGAGGTCVTKPSVCSKIYKPVCGCDNTTYSNDCLRLQAGVAQKHVGVCKAVDAGPPPPIDGSVAGCGGPTNIPCNKGFFCDQVSCAKSAKGSCVQIPGICPMVYKPVCGCDNKTYGNDCIRRAAQVSLNYVGQCKPAQCQVDCDCTQGLMCVKSSTGNQCIAGFVPVYCCTKSGCPTSQSCVNPDGTKGTCP